MNPQDVLLISREASELAGQLSDPLLEWYGKNARSLPWREDSAPYRVWISEIMLQQTRVEAVKGYYSRFLDALPTIEALAGASEDTLLKLWEGLGYYSRARNLQKAACALLEKFEGRLPASYRELLTLPGVGEYTAGAIASIAFGIPVPAVDGNVLRVYSRILTSYADITLPGVKQAYRQLIGEALPASRPGDFNQAVMELGATVCVPNAAPLCGRCPLAELCTGFRSGAAAELPVKTAKKARRVESRTIIVIIAGCRVLLFRRGKGLLRGMYEPVNLPDHMDARQVGEAARRLGAAPKKEMALAASKHLFSHVEWRMQGWLVYSDSFPAPENAVWADKAELASDYAVPSAFRTYTGDIPLWLEP